MHMSNVCPNCGIDDVTRMILNKMTKVKKNTEVGECRSCLWKCKLKSHKLQKRAQFLYFQKIG